MKTILLKTVTATTLLLSVIPDGNTRTVTPGEGLTVPSESTVVDGYDDADTAEERLSQLPLHPVEGLWRFPADGGLVAVERCDLGGNTTEASQYRMVIITSANRALRPGTVMGYLWGTAQKAVYEASLFTDETADGTTLKSPKKFVISLTDNESRLVFKPIRRGLKLNLWRMLPYMFRFAVRQHDNTPDNLNGCVRVYPRPEIPDYPRYL